MQEAFAGQDPGPAACGGVTLGGTSAGGPACTGLGAWRGAGAADSRPAIFRGSEWSCERTSAGEAWMPGTRVVSAEHSRSCSGFRGGRENPCPAAKGRPTPAPTRERGSIPRVLGGASSGFSDRGF